MWINRIKVTKEACLNRYSIITLKHLWIKTQKVKGLGGKKFSNACPFNMKCTSWSLRTVVSVCAMQCALTLRNPETMLSHPHCTPTETPTPLPTRNLSGPSTDWALGPLIRALLSLSLSALAVYASIFPSWTRVRSPKHHPTSLWYLSPLTSQNEG